MSKLTLAKVLALRPVSGRLPLSWYRTQRLARHQYGRLAKLARGLATSCLLLGGGLGMLVSCTEDKPRSPDSEMIVDQSDAAKEDGAAEAEQSAAIQKPAADIAPAQPAGPLTGTGRHYRVAVGTAYFFDAPQQSTPNGRYLRRGDEFYGEGETNGFVKTGFEAPNGVKSTGWLKKQELTTLRGRSATKVAAASKPPRPAAPAPAEYEPAAAASAPDAPVRRAAPVPADAQVAVVQVARSYFFNTADLNTPRLAHCVRGDKVRLGETRGEAVYVTFTNWQNVTSRGWMRRDALSASR